MSFTVYKSSAGSGKTFTLVKEYLKIALAEKKPDRYRHILAITFTNKAANEMKERVLQALEALASGTELTGTPYYLQQALLQEIDIDHTELSERAARVLEHILHHYSDFSISTIDKFSHRVIRAFAFDLKLPLNFEVEVETHALLQQAVDLLLNRVGTDDDLTKLLVAYSEAKANEEKNWRIDLDLFNLSSTIFKEGSAEHLDRLKTVSMGDFFGIREKLVEHLYAFEEKVSNLGNEALDLIKSKNIAHAAFAGGATRGLPKYFSYLAEFRESKLWPSDSVLGYIEKDKWFSTKANAIEQASIEVIKDALVTIFNEVQEVLNTDVRTFYLYQLLEKNIFPLAVLNELEKLIQDVMDENQLVHISEFNHRIAEVVLSEPAPFIYERLGERYQHFLVDEFQDTSSMQWQNLLPLLDNSLASGNFNMVVGDGKQAIYRWRGGEVEQFSRLPEVNDNGNPFVAERAETLKRHHNPQELANNFRSKAEIVHFNNRLFAYLTRTLDPELAPIYTGLKQNFDKTNTGGLVMLQQYPDHASEPYRDWTQQRLIHQIGLLRMEGIALRDICLLCRTNRDASELAHFLVKEGVPVVSSESLLVSSSQNVQFLVAALCYLADPQPLVWQTQMIAWLINTGRIKADLHETLRDLRDWTLRLPTWMQENGYKFSPGRLKQFPVYELAEELLRLFGLAETPEPFLAFFMESLHQFGSRHQNNLTDLPDWWAEQASKLSIVIPEGTEAVTVMSIHKSKGLEFPVVLFPFADWRGGAFKNLLWIDLDEPDLQPLPTALVPAQKSLQDTDYDTEYERETARDHLDNINLLYVALTRPRERLYIYTNGSGIAQHFMPFITTLEKKWDERSNTLLIGKPSAISKSHSEGNVTPIELTQLVSADWRPKLSISMQAQKLWNIDQHAAENRNSQLIVTALLELRHTDDTERVLNELNARGLITETEKEPLAHKLSLLLGNEAIANLFGRNTKARREPDLLLTSGEILRPHRLIADGETATVIDFRTATASDTERAQLLKYETALKGMGFTSVTKLLLNTEDEQLEHIN